MCEAAGMSAQQQRRACKLPCKLLSNQPAACSYYCAELRRPLPLFGS